jgi:hypothetical protein
MQMNLSDSAVVVVCVSKGSMHDANQEQRYQIIPFSSLRRSSF